MNAKRYSTEFKSSIVVLYNEGRSANSLANEYHLAVQTVMSWVKKTQIVGKDVTGEPITRAQFNCPSYFRCIQVYSLVQRRKNQSFQSKNKSSLITSALDKK